MSRIRLFASLSLVFGLTAFGTIASAKGKKGYHCEVKKNGKTKDMSADEVPDRKACKAMGGKWVKSHDHSHGEEGEDHSHDEE